MSEIEINSKKLMNNMMLNKEIEIENNNNIISVNSNGCVDPLKSFNHNNAIKKDILINYCKKHELE